MREVKVRSAALVRRDILLHKKYFNFIELNQDALTLKLLLLKNNIYYLVLYKSTSPFLPGKDVHGSERREIEPY